MLFRSGSGFINHYPSGATDDYLGLTIGQTLENDIKIDCKYIVEQSKKDGRPATGGGEPADMPTGPAQSVLDKSPYIQLSMITGFRSS